MIAFVTKLCDAAPDIDWKREPRMCFFAPGVCPFCSGRNQKHIQGLGGLCTSGKTGLRKASNFPDAEHKSGVNVFDGVSNSDGGIDGKSLYPTRFAVPPDIDGVGCRYLRRRLQLSNVNTHTLKASILAGSAGGSSTRSFIRST